MPLYRPISIPALDEAIRDNGVRPDWIIGSDLLRFDWSPGGVEADFSLTIANDLIIRVSFDRPCIVRLLDETALSTEEDGTTEGLVRYNFAYEVEGSRFAAPHSTAWKLMQGGMRHFLFVTDPTCLDVLSAAWPSLTLMTSAGEQR